MLLVRMDVHNIFQWVNYSINRCSWQIVWCVACRVCKVVKIGDRNPLLQKRKRRGKDGRVEGSGMEESGLESPPTEEGRVEEWKERGSHTTEESNA